MTDKLEQEKAKQWWAENAATFHQPGKMGFFMTDVLAAYASSQLSSKEAELAELRTNNQSQADMIGGYIEQISAAKDAGIAFSWNGRIAEAHNSLREQVERLTSQILDYENREAACCPEDVGFEEMIAVLRKKVASMETALKFANELLSFHNMAVCDKHAVSWKLDAYSSCPECANSPSPSTTQEK